MVVEERSPRHPAARAAYRLSNALERHGIATEVHEGRGLALVSIWVDLVAWTDGSCYFWWSGGVSQATRRRTYSYGPVDDPVTAAGRVAERYAELRRGPVAAGTSAMVGVSTEPMVVTVAEPMTGGEDP